MRALFKHAMRMVLVIAAGGFVSATLVRVAPGYGSDEEALDGRLNGDSQAWLRSARDESAMHFYANYCRRLAHGDLGVSVALNEPVARLLAERIPETAKTMAVGLALAWCCGLCLGIVSIVPGMRVVSGSGAVLASMLLCLPAAVLAMLFVLAEAPARIAVGLIVFPRVYQFLRGVLRRSAGMAHVVTARAKGVGETRILVWHVLPVAAPQILALGGVSVCMALAACIPVESVCDLPGIGQLAWRAALSRDLPLLVDLTMLVTLVTVAANGASDLVSRHLQEGPR